MVDAEIRAAQSERERNATRASLFYDELPVGKLQDERKLAAFFAFFCLSVLHTLRLNRTWSLIMMQKGQNYAAEAEVGSFFDFFNFADFTTTFPYCGKHFEFP